MRGTLRACEGRRYTSAGKRLRSGLVAFGVLLSAALAGCSGKDAPVQSDMRLAEYELAGPVKMGGSDWKSRKFVQSWAGDLILRASGSFNSGAIRERFADVVLDPTRLELTEATSVRVYFVGEASGYRCALGFKTKGPDGSTTPPRFIFPNKEAQVGLYEYPGRIDKKTKRLDLGKAGTRTNDTPLLPGDYVDLGRLPAGTRLDFFLIAKDGKGKINTYWSRVEDNPDGVAHVAAIAVPESPYLLLSFEDMYGGGDKDFSDCVFAVEMSDYNIQALMGQIDPLRRAKQMALVGTVLLVVIGGPLSFFAVKRYLRIKRLKQIQKDAQQLLETSDPEKALVLVRQAKKAGANRSEREALTDLELTALERLDRAVDLHNLYTEAPESFQDHEPASQSVGRVQIAEGHLDEYADLRHSWHKREQRGDDWVALDADALQKQGRAEEAKTLLNARAFAGAQDAKRLARLGQLAASTEPAQARQLIGQALQLAPQDPDVQLHAADAAEALGDLDAAVKSYGAALALKPKDPVTRDQAAEFYRRQGGYPQALQVWTAGLDAPTSETIWLKTLFWRRVACPVSVESKGVESLEGDTRLLIDFMRSLPPEQFWDATRFTALAEKRPDFESRQDVFWLRLLDALRGLREADALSLLNLQRFGRDSWNEDLEVALIRLVTYRSLGFMDPSLVKAGEAAPGAAEQHPFFLGLEQWASGSDVPEALQKLVKSGEAYAAAFLAAGWCEAGLRMRRSETIDPGWPDWFARDMEKALRQRAAAASDQTGRLR